jgi:hypothetical protein
MDVSDIKAVSIVLMVQCRLCADGLAVGIVAIFEIKKPTEYTLYS